MRQYDTLGKTIEKVRHEAGQSTHAGYSGHDRDKIVHLINRVQQQLAVQYDWPRRMNTVALMLVPGQHTYSLPEPLNFEGVDRVTHERYGTAIELQYGVTPEMRAYLSPDAEKDRRDKPRAWDYALRESATRDQITVWPTPRVETELEIEGTGELAEATNESSRLAFPGHIIALYVAAEILAEQGDELSSAKMSMADNLTRNTLGRQRNKSQAWGLGRAGEVRRRPRYGLDYIE